MLITLALLALTATSLAGAHVWQWRHEGQGVCLSNLKQMGQAFRVYAEDQDGATPLAATWPDAVHSLTMDAEMLVCPADRRRDRQYALSTHYEAILRTSYTQSAVVNGQPLEGFGNPQLVLLHFEGTALSGGAEIMAPRHNGGACMSYLDGHVKWHRPEDIGPEAWAARKRR